MSRASENLNVNLLEGYRLQLTKGFDGAQMDIILLINFHRAFRRSVK